MSCWTRYNVENMILGTCQTEGDVPFTPTNGRRKLRKKKYQKLNRDKTTGELHYTITGMTK